MNFDKFSTALDLEKMISLRDVIFCGSFGDPLMHPQIDKFIDFFEGKNINFSTNASLRSKEWWEKLATRKNVSVTFCIDGIGDVHEKYRINTSYKKIMGNAEAYIKAGGKASWQFIVFKHNHHQIEDAKKLSKKLGFSEIHFRESERFVTGDKWPVYVEGQYKYDLEPSPDNNIIHNKLLSQQGINYVSDLVKNSSKQPITCQWSRDKKIYIHGDGTVFPCCMIANITAGDRLTLNIFEKLVKNYEEINIYKNNLDAILDGPEYKEYFKQSLVRTPHPTCIEYCDKFAGIKNQENIAVK